MFFFHIRIDPTDDFHVVCTHLMGLFYGTDIKVEMMDKGYDSMWILVHLTATKDECLQFGKRMRRLARGKPRFQISLQNISEVNETPQSRLVAWAQQVVT